MQNHAFQRLENAYFPIQQKTNINISQFPTIDYTVRQILNDRAPYFQPKTGNLSYNIN